jgi:hypothetical protein
MLRPPSLPLPRPARPSFTLLWSGEGVSLLGTAATSVLLPLLAVTRRTLLAPPAGIALLDEQWHGDQRMCSLSSLAARTGIGGPASPAGRSYGIRGSSHENAERVSRRVGENVQGFI